MADNEPAVSKVSRQYPTVHRLTITESLPAKERLEREHEAIAAHLNSKPSGDASTLKLRRRIRVVWVEAFPPKRFPSRLGSGKNGDCVIEPSASGPFGLRLVTIPPVKKTTHRAELPCVSKAS